MLVDVRTYRCVPGTINAHLHLHRAGGHERGPLRRSSGGRVELRAVFGGHDQGGEDAGAVLLPGKSPCAQVFKRRLTYLLKKNRRSGSTRRKGPPRVWAWGR